MEGEAGVVDGEADNMEGEAAGMECEWTVSRRSRR